MPKYPPPPAASVAETEAGTVKNKFVSPYTAAQAGFGSGGNPAAAATNANNTFTAPNTFSGALNVTGSGGNVLTAQRPQNATPQDFETIVHSSYPFYRLTGTGASAGYLAEPSPFIYSNIQYVACGGWTNGSPNSNGCIVFASGPNMYNLSLLSTGTIVGATVAAPLHYVSGPSVYQWNGTNYMDVFASTNYTFESTYSQIYEGWSTGDPTKASNWHFSGGYVVSNSASGFMSGNLYRCFSLPLDATGNNWVKYFNASGDASGEAIGMMFSTTGPLGPWSLYSSNPIFKTTQATNVWHDATMQGVGDPCVIPVVVGNTPAWLMAHTALSANYFLEGWAISYDMTNFVEVSSNVPCIGNLVNLTPYGPVRQMYENTGKKWLGVGDYAAASVWFFEPRPSMDQSTLVGNDFYVPGGAVDINGTYAVIDSLSINSGGELIDTTSGHTIGISGTPWAAVYSSAYNGNGTNQFLAAGASPYDGGHITNILSAASISGSTASNSITLNDNSGVPFMFGSNGVTWLSNSFTIYIAGGKTNVQVLQTGVLVNSKISMGSNNVVYGTWDTNGGLTTVTVTASNIYAGNLGQVYPTTNSSAGGFVVQTGNTNFAPVNTANLSFATNGGLNSANGLTTGSNSVFYGGTTVVSNAVFAIGNYTNGLSVAAMLRCNIWNVDSNGIPCIISISNGTARFYDFDAQQGGIIP